MTHMKQKIAMHILSLFRVYVYHYMGISKKMQSSTT